MIVTNAGKAGVNSNDQVTIDKVVFSDFSLSSISDYEQQQITAIQGINTVAANPTVALLSNGHALVQSSVAANFNVNSVFILANGNDSEFLMAVTDSNGSLNEEINIDAIRRLTFNATANNLVMKSDVSSLVASAVSALPSSSDDASSYAADAYNRANDYTNSYVEGKLNANLNLDSTYASQAYSSATSYADSRLSTKVDAAELSNYATQSELSNYATNSVLADYATNSTVNSASSAINSQLANKADISSLAPLATQSSVDNKLITKVDTTQLANYLTVESANDQLSAINSAVAIKANLTDLSSYATQSQFSDTSQLINTNSNVLNKLQESALQYYGVWKGNVLDLSTQPDGIYEMYANQQGCPDNYDGYGFVIKIHNTWNSLLLLFDNNFYQWTNRQGAQGWNGWRQLVDTEMVQGSMIDASSASSHIAFLQSKADTDAGNIINNNKLINSLAAEIDLLKAKQ